MSELGRDNPAHPAFRPVGTGFQTLPGCTQCQKPAGRDRKYGKALSGSLRGMKGWLCAACCGVNAKGAA